MNKPYDVIVVGLGAMGSASLHALATAGKRVLGIDRFAPPHSNGSSHGRTRIIREAYFEHPAYVPIVRRAFDLWRDLERASGKRLYTKTRGINIGPEDGVLVSGALASAKAFHVPHRVLSSTGIQRHFPGLRPLDDWVGVLEDRAGVLFPEECIATLLAQATKAGAEVRADDAVLAWKADAHGVQVATSGGIYTAAQLVLSAGAWMPRLVSDLAPALAVVRQPIHWFEPTHPEQYSAAQCPVTLWEFGKGHFFYTLPDFGDGVKAGVHYEGQRVDPDHVNRQTSTEEEAQVTDLLRRFMPHAKGHLRSTQVCLYTNTPDLHFVIDMHPSHPRQVAVVSACSGHGFKFATAIGEIVKDMLAGAAPRYDLSMFRMNRFQVGT